MDDLTTIARPYASAAFDLATQDGKLADWSESLALLGGIVSDETVQLALANPHISREQGVELILSIAEGHLSDQTANFVRVMGDNDRLAALPEVAHRFETLKAEAEQKVEVEVTSAYALNAKYQKVIEEAMKARLGCEVLIKKEIDRDLIAGVVIRAGDLVIDASAKGRLDALAQQLSA